MTSSLYLSLDIKKLVIFFSSQSKRNSQLSMELKNHVSSWLDYNKAWKKNNNNFLLNKN